MEQLLVISALGHDRPGIVNDLSRTILDAGGNINDSRMSVLGGEFAVILLVASPADKVAKLEECLQVLGQDKNLTINSRATHAREEKVEMVPWHIELVAIDHPGIVYKISSYLSEQQVNIQDLETRQYKAPHTGATMFSVDMDVAVPVSLGMNQFREQFVDFCDQLNLDASLEAIRQ